MNNWESLFEKKISEVATNDDPAHDLLHFKRVVKIAKKICLQENAQTDIVVPAAWLHDLVIMPKDDTRRSKASKLSAEAAVEFLHEIEYPQQYIENIAHAIECHSFSANITPTTLEAKVVQDADRLDGLGAIGIARCFAVAGMLKRGFYSEQDPFCKSREPNDNLYTIDHFYRKLFKTAESLQTESGRKEGQRRVLAMKRYLIDLTLEIDP